MRGTTVPAPEATRSFTTAEVARITGASYLDPDLLTTGFQRAMVITAALAALGGVLAAVLVRNPERVEAEPVPAPTGWFCGVEGPPLDTCPGSTAGQAPTERAA